MALVTTAVAKRKIVLSRMSATMLADILEAASDMVENYCDRVFTYAASITEVINGNGTDTLYVKYLPIVTVTSITITDSDGTTELLDSNDYVIEEDAGCVTFGPQNDSTYAVFPNTYPQNVSVVYAGGYSSIPEALQEATVLVAIQMLSQSAANANPQFKSESIGDYSMTRFGSGEEILTPQVKALLAPYRRLEFF